MRFAHLILSAVVLGPGVLHAGESNDVQLVRGGRNYQLPEQTRAQVADRLPKLFATCSLNSRDYPGLFASSSMATLWTDAEAGDYVKLRLAKPMDIRIGDRPVISIQEFLLGLEDPKFPGPELSRVGDTVIAYVKCSGKEMIEFVCVAEIKAVMPDGYHELCRHLSHTNDTSARPTLAAQVSKAVRR
jgi:hypothetical protein